MTNPIIQDYSDLNKFNQCVDWGYGFRIFVRPDGTITHPQHMGKLTSPLNYVYWKSQGYTHAIRVWPKAYMSSKAVGI